MGRKSSSHKDMAEVNIYTAKRLNDMAISLERLARAFSDEIGREKKLTREDGLAAVQMAAAMICKDCSRCSIYSDSTREDNYYLYYLLRAFEQKGQVEYEDMPQVFAANCRKKEDYLGYLNRNLGKATMNLSWKNRFLESRDAVVSQFRELSVILEEFSHQMEQAVDVTSMKEEAVNYQFNRHHMEIENMLMLEYENKQREAYLTVRTTNRRCFTAREAADILASVMGSHSWIPAQDSRSIITRKFSTIRLIEEGCYRMTYGVARAVKGKEQISGDNYTFTQSCPGKVMMSLSDGMGSGQMAEEESRRVIELTEQLLTAGFTARSALKLVNTVLLLCSSEQHPATMDLCCVDLHSGVLEAMKMGAVATFILVEDGVELLEAGEVPVGIMTPVEPVLLSRKLWDDNRIIMVSDGILDVLPGEEKEQTLREYLEGMPKKTPQDMAERVLAFARSFVEEPRDDMTVLTAGIWKMK